MKILVINSGSTTQKIDLVEIAECLQTPKISILRQSNRHVKKGQSRKELIKNQLEQMLYKATYSPSIDIVGHRIVHGGPKYYESCFVTSDVRSDIVTYSKLAPLHNLAGLDGIDAVKEFLPTIPQVAVFDTSAHRSMPLRSRVYPLPFEWYQDLDVQRYGFHGINHSYCYEKSLALYKRNHSESTIKWPRVVVCHLGGGCSLAAMHKRRSVDTTMGFTPLDGLMMATRCGSIDPGIVNFLCRELQLSVDELERILNEDSGLKGLSGLSGDMQELIQAEHNGNSKAQLAIDVYIHQLNKGIASMAASMNGIDILVFTGGVGENSDYIREKSCKGLEFLKVKLNPVANSMISTDGSISSRETSVIVMVIYANESQSIAEQCYKLVVGNKNMNLV